MHSDTQPLSAHHILAKHENIVYHLETNLLVEGEGIVTVVICLDDNILRTMLLEAIQSFGEDGST